MPDSHRFNVEPHRGSVYHRCIDCDFPGWGHTLTESQRRRHHQQHQRERAREIERARLANLREARRVQRLAERDNKLAYGGGL